MTWLPVRAFLAMYVIFYIKMRDKLYKSIVFIDFFFVNQIPKDSFSVVKTKDEIFNNYYTSWMPLDIASLVPLEFFAFGFGPV